MEDGKRFSQVYLERGAPTRDGKRFRNRLSAYYEQKISYKYGHPVAYAIETETGSKVPRVGLDGFEMDSFFEKAQLRDVLDSITVVYRVLEQRQDKTEAISWKGFVTRVFQEETLGYRLDSKCGVHYAIDEEFERNRTATLQALDDPKYNGVCDAYESAYRYMDSIPPDTKAAVRSMFEALESLVRMMVETKNLNRWIIENTLKEKCLALYASEPTAVRVVSDLFDGFADWVDTLHNYRHGHPSEQPVAPTEEVAVYVLSSGSAFLRWLIGINNQLNQT